MIRYIARVGELYYPIDNSYCINYDTGEDALIATCPDIPKSFNPSADEIGAKYVVISEPYNTVVTDKFTNHKRSVNVLLVRSLQTNKRYRCLFHPASTQTYRIVMKLKNKN